ncbi:MAG: cytochrome P450, partial [Acidimicrobiia bacterium]|nr:cytochrome P450 [Acidimicrobiia bacterium]
MTETVEEERFVLRGGETWRDPYPAYARLRDTAPAHRVARRGHDDFYVLSRFADVFEAVRDTATFSSAQGLTPDADAMAMFEGEAAPIVMMDPPDHTAMRRLVSRPMTPRRVALFEDEVRAFVDLRLDQLEASGPGDIVDALFKPLPSFVVAHYLGVPVEDRARFDGWTNAIVAANAEGELANAMDAAMDLFGYANELIERRTVEPGDDLVSDLVAVGPEVASPMWIVGFVFTMVTGGNDTTTGLLGGAAELLTAHRDQRRILVDDPTLIRGAVDEFLRLVSPVQNLARTTTRGVELHGVEIPEGVKVLLLYAAANRDEREFGPMAEQLDVRRERGRMLSLGYGPHHCLG